MEDEEAKYPIVANNALPPFAGERDGYLRMLFSRADTGAVRYTRVEQWEIVGAQAPALWRAEFRRWPLAIGALTLVAFTALITWWVSAPSVIPARTPGVTVALPAGVVRPAASRAYAAAPPPARMAVVAAAPVAPATSAVTDPEATPETQKAALVRAFATNEAWPWKGGTTRGLVVVGPGDIVAGSLCRDVAIITRGENIPDRTANSRMCQEPGGEIVDAEQSSR